MYLHFGRRVTPAYNTMSKEHCIRVCYCHGVTDGHSEPRGTRRMLPLVSTAASTAASTRRLRCWLRCAEDLIGQGRRALGGEALAGERPAAVARTVPCGPGQSRPLLLLSAQVPLCSSLSILGAGPTGGRTNITCTHLPGV
jgi:hypothetical protein